MGEKATILALDDEPRSLETLGRILEDDFNVLTAATTGEAEAILAREWVQVILCDQRMPGMTGVEFLKRVRQLWPDVVRIILSGYTEPSDIIQGINEAGIYQYLTKPWHPDQLILTINNAVRLFHLQRQSDLLALEMKVATSTLETRTSRRREALKHTFRYDSLVRTADSPLNATVDQIQRVAPFDISVLITGESGSGKELIARALHYNSLRADGPFVVENCGALPDQLLESELFGHKRGAFTGAVEDRVGLFEQADGGTVFLDEIGDISPAFQVKLLRVLQEGEIRPLGSNQRRRVDIRVIAATNRDLETEVRAGRYRDDLYYRLATTTIRVPPLRERRMDIPTLARALLEQAIEQHGKRVRGFTDEALECMQAYHWPGNVRELQNEVQCMLVMGSRDLLGAELLSPRILQATPGDEGWDEPEPGLEPGEGTLKERLDSLEARILREALIRNRWNKSKTARELGLSRVGLRSKLERHGLEKIQPLKTRKRAGGNGD